MATRIDSPTHSLFYTVFVCSHNKKSWSLNLKKKKNNNNNENYDNNNNTNTDINNDNGDKDKSYNNINNNHIKNKTVEIDWGNTANSLTQSRLVFFFLQDLLAWVNVPVYDFQGRLQRGDHEFPLWLQEVLQQPEEFCNPIGKSKFVVVFSLSIVYIFFQSLSISNNVCVILYVKMIIMCVHGLLWLLIGTHFNTRALFLYYIGIILLYSEMTALVQ